MPIRPVLRRRPSDPVGPMCRWPLLPGKYAIGNVEPLPRGYILRSYGSHGVVGMHTMPSGELLRGGKYCSSGLPWWELLDAV